MGCVVVTGAAGGIGQALTHAFAEGGHAVIGVDVAPAPVDSPGEHHVVCDLALMAADEVYADEVFAVVREALRGRPLLALVNNAAVQVLRPVPTLNRDAWRCTLDVNLLAPFLWTQALLPELSATHGCVLNISSIHARLTKPGFVAYATSKAALSGMTRAMAVELGSKIRVNAIEPAAIDTAMLRAGFADNPAGYRELTLYHPTRAIGSPEDMAVLARAIVDQPGGFANGSVIAFDGGIGAVLHDPG